MQSWIFQLGDFASRHFAGNAAVVMLLDTYPADSVLQALAGENNQAETVFVVPNAQDYCIRWFTPAIKVPLCGHATLASAAVILERLQPARLTVLFHSASSPLSVRRSGSAYVMDFPARRCAPARPPDGLAAAPQSPLLETMWDGFNVLVRLESPDAVRALTPDLAAIAHRPCAGIIVTAAGDGTYDYTSHYFAPAKGIPEAPVTGGAHCALAPFWARLGKTELRAPSRRLLEAAK